MISEEASEYTEVLYIKVCDTIYGDLARLIPEEASEYTEVQHEFPSWHFPSRTNSFDLTTFVLG